MRHGSFWLKPTVLVATLLWLGTSFVAPAETIFDGQATSVEAARKVWTAGLQTPEAAMEPAFGVVSLPCPFAARRDADRFFWDRRVRLDLSRYTSFAFDVDVTQPAAIRSFMIYFESGNGWYVWGKALDRAGRQTIRLAPSDFSIEGKPAGWNQITRVRISPYRGESVDTRILLFKATAENPPVLVVRGTGSVKSDGEKRVANDVASRISGWLSDSRIPHGTLDDEQVDDSHLARASVLILGYNPEPAEKEHAALIRFLKRGGKLVVCYSADAPLAAAMDFTLDEYKQTDDPAQWTAYSFDDARAHHVPVRVYQRSGNLRAARPATAAARVIAWWENASGRKTGDPAWTMSDHGVWMSHILTSEDPVGKRGVLTGLLVGMVPELGPYAARGAIEESGRIDSFPSFEATVAALRAASSKANEAGPHLEAAVAARDRMVKAADARQYGTVLDEGRTVRQALVEAYARVQRPQAGERRGVWDHDAVGWYPGDWDRTCEILHQHGITDIFVNALWPGLAHFKSEKVARSFTFRKYGDQLDQCVSAAHRRGIKVHLWKVCWSLDNAAPDVLAAARKEHRLQSDAQGNEIRWLDPCLPANVEFELAPLREAVRNYALDGVHLDYIRYPGAHACFSKETQAAFEREQGARATPWPSVVQPGGRLHAAYLDWRMRQQTAFVRRVSTELRALRPGLAISAAVFGNYPVCRESIGQDWRLWLEQGTLDFVCPMNYTENLSAFTSLVARQTALPSARGKVWPGIGVDANESQLGADQVIEQVLAGRRLGAPGFVLFSLDTELRDRILPPLAMGLTAE